MENVELNPFLINKKQMVEATETMTDIYMSAHDRALKVTGDELKADKIATNVLTGLVKSNLEE